LCVPEIVVREMVNQFQEALTAAHERLAAAERELGNLLGRAISQRVDANAIRSAGVRYDAELREILASHGVSIEPLPAELACVELLLQRDLGRRKPFGDRKSSDRRSNRRDRGGMRDALIWETVLKLCRQERRSLALITDNTDDFADDSKKRLHQHLLRDLHELHIQPEEVRFYRSIQEFSNAHLATSGVDNPTEDTPATASTGEAVAEIDDTSD